MVAQESPPKAPPAWERVTHKRRTPAAQRQCLAKQRGIYLISTLFLIVLTIMMLGAALKLVPQNLSAAGQFDDRLNAEAAARMGTEYAPSWKGDGNAVDHQPGAAGPGRTAAEGRPTTTVFIRSAFEVRSAAPTGYLDCS